MQVVANAKINLSLNVKSRDENGYHQLDSIMVPLEFGDVLTIEEINEETYLTSNITGIPLDESNLVMKAYRFMQAHYGVNKNFHIHIEKEIPSQAGLGGGSSDAGALIRFLLDYCEIKEHLEEVAIKSVEIGADLPFCVLNTPRRVEGIGEISRSIRVPALSEYHVLLVKPYEGVSTKVAYETLDLKKCAHPNIDELVASLTSGELLHLGNSLEQSAFVLVPHIKGIKEKLVELGFEYSMMSGSGSCVFGLTKSESVLSKGFDYFKEKEEFVKKTRIICE